MMLTFSRLSSIFLLLILLIGINAESVSLSSMNLIPGIVSKLRFVQENLVSSKIDFNHKESLIRSNLKLNANSSNCSQDLALLFQDVMTYKPWALKSKSSC